MTLFRHLPAALLLALVGAGCNACDRGEPLLPRENQPNIKWCPGSPGCLRTGKGEIRAGVGKRNVTPRGFEIANVNYLKATTCDPVMETRFGAKRCGELREDPRNCGMDGICPNDTGWPGPDSDGSEGSDPFGAKPDWFFDCGLDRICPLNSPEADDLTTPTVNESVDGVDNDGDGAIDDGAWPGADEGEGDGQFQGAWIAGFGNSRPAMGVYDPVEVRCFALNTHQTTVVLCSLDVVGFFNDEVERARALFYERHPELDIDYLAVASTHTHESVDTLGQWGHADPIPITPGRLEGHNAYVVDQIVEAAAEAVSTLEPAKLVLARTATGREGFLSDHRDPQIFDDEMIVLEARTKETGRPIFTAVNWGNHPEVMGADNSLISSDYPHPLREALEKGLPAAGNRPALPGRGGVGIYLNGAVGGIMTPLGVDFLGRDGRSYPPSSETFARMEAYGENLADLALTALQDESKLVTVEEGELQVKAERFFIPVVNRIFIFAFAAGLFDRVVYDELTGLVIDTEFTSLLDVTGSARTEVFTVELGEWGLFGVPGELFPESSVGGYDGTRTLGMPLVNPDFCPPQESCRAEDAEEECPVDRPDGGWNDCVCEQCRLCAAPDLTKAPPGPYLKDRLGPSFKMALGLANDELGYLVPPWQWQVSETAPYFCDALDHYEETNSTGEIAVPRVEAALDKLFNFGL